MIEVKISNNQTNKKNNNNRDMGECRRLICFLTLNAIPKKNLPRNAAAYGDQRRPRVINLTAFQEHRKRLPYEKPGWHDKRNVPLRLQETSSP